MTFGISDQRSGICLSKYWLRKRLLRVSSNTPHLPIRGAVAEPPDFAEKEVVLLIDDEPAFHATCGPIIDKTRAHCEIFEIVWESQDNAKLPIPSPDFDTFHEWLAFDPPPKLWWPIAMMQPLADIDDGVGAEESKDEPEDSDDDAVDLTAPAADENSAWV